MKTKRSITKWAVAGLIAMVPAGILLPSSLLALNRHNDAFDSYGSTLGTLALLGYFFVMAGLLIEIVAWLGALRRLRDVGERQWRRGVLWAGLVGIFTIPLFGLGLFLLGSALTAYLVAGPESETPSKASIGRWTTWAFAGGAGGTVLSLFVANLTNPGRPLHGVVWPSLAIESVGFTAIATGGVLLGVAWWGALANARRLADRKWFSRLVWSAAAGFVTMPLLGLGALIVIATLGVYLRDAPDSTASSPPSLVLPERKPPHRLAS